MRFPIAILAFTLAAHAVDLQKLNRIPLGHPIRVNLADRTSAEGRLLAVEGAAVKLQVPVNGAMAEREIAFADIASVRELKANQFGRDVKRGLAVTLGVITVFVVIALITTVASH